MCEGVRTDPPSQTGKNMIESSAVNKKTNIMGFLRPGARSSREGEQRV